MNPAIIEKPSRLRRGSVLSAIGASIALIASILISTAAIAAPPQSGSYLGTSTAYTGANFSFDIDANGVMHNFDATSYCFDGMFTQSVIWTGTPGASIEAGHPFDREWQYNDGGFGIKYELQGIVNADGTASDTGRASFLPSSPCGGMEFNWSAAIDGDGGDPAPQDPEIVLEKNTFYDYEIQRIMMFQLL